MATIPHGHPPFLGTHRAASIAATNAAIAAGSMAYTLGSTILQAEDGTMMTLQGVGAAARFLPTPSTASVDAAVAAAAASAQAAVDTLAGAAKKSELAAVNGSDGLGFGLDDDPSLARPARQKMAERKSLFDKMPLAEHAGVRARTSILDCAGAFAIAIAACVAAGGDTLNLPGGTFCYKPLPNGQDLPVSLQGAGRGKTIIKVIDDGVVFNRLAQSELRGLTIDLQGNVNGPQGTPIAATACVFKTGSFGARDDAIEIKNANATTGLCIDFQSNGGSMFVSTGSTYYTLATPGVRAAVAVTGTDTAATSRHFTDAESGGCTLYDFGGCNDFYVSGGYTNGLIFNAASSKVLMTNVRIGAAGGTVTVRGQAKLSNCIFAGPVILEGTNHRFDCEVPGFDITDNSTGSQVEIKSRAYTPAWTASTTAPSLGNGTLKGFFDRTGNRITITIDLTIGSTTSVGAGVWAFSEPKLDAAAMVQASGGGFTQCGAGTNFQLNARTSPGGQKVELFYVNGSGALANLAANSRTWATGDNLRFTHSYVCA